MNTTGLGSAGPASSDLLLTRPWQSEGVATKSLIIDAVEAARTVHVIGLPARDHAIAVSVLRRFGAIEDYRTIPARTSHSRTLAAADRGELSLDSMMAKIYAESTAALSMSAGGEDADLTEASRHNAVLFPILTPLRVVFQYQASAAAALEMRGRLVVNGRTVSMRPVPELAGLMRDDEVLQYYGELPHRTAWLAGLSLCDSSAHPLGDGKDKTRLLGRLSRDSRRQPQAPSKRAPARRVRWPLLQSLPLAEYWLAPVTRLFPDDN